MNKEKMKNMPTNIFLKKDQDTSPHFVNPKNRGFSKKDSDEYFFKRINQNLFNLEKDIAFFSFAVKEIEDITNS